MELREAIVIVTGAARGLGRAIAEAFAAQKARIAIVDVLEEQLQKTAAEMKKTGGTVLPIVTDITVKSQVFAVAPPAILTDMTKFIMNDPGGKKWRPGFGKIFEEGRDHPPEMVANFILKLVSGKADHLTGRYFRPWQDFDEIIKQSDKIIADGLLTLRLRE